MNSIFGLHFRDDDHDSNQPDLFRIRIIGTFTLLLEEHIHYTAPFTCHTVCKT